MTKIEELEERILKLEEKILMQELEERIRKLEKKVLMQDMIITKIFDTSIQELKKLEKESKSD